MKKIKEVEDIIDMLGDHERMGVKYAMNNVTIKELTAHRTAVFMEIKSFFKNRSLILK